MPKSDWLALLISYVYVFAIIFAGEGLRKWRGYSVDFTRKVIHIGVGTWVFGTVALFERWYLAIIPPLTFIVINYISYRQQVFKAMETGEKGQLGTVYLPISFAVLLWLFWSRPHIAAAGIMAMTWGDAFGSIIGLRWGRRKYEVFDRTRSLEGSAAMFAFSFASILITLVAMTALGWPATFLYALTAAVFATVVEAFSPWGIDNLTVPILSAGLLYLIGV